MPRRLIKKDEVEQLAELVEAAVRELEERDAGKRPDTVPSDGEPTRVEAMALLTSGGDPETVAPPPAGDEEETGRSSEDPDGGTGSDRWPLGTRIGPFVEFAVRRPLENNASNGPWYGFAFSSISVAVIGLGLLSSVIAAAGNPNDWVIAAIGLAVGVLTAINQIWRPAQRSVSRHQAAHSLRREAWDLVMARGRYRKHDGIARVNEFVDEVGRIQRGVEAIDESASEVTAPNAA